MTGVGLYTLRLARAEAVGRRDARRDGGDLIDYYMPPVCACGELATATHRCTPAEFLSLSGRVNGGLL